MSYVKSVECSRCAEAFAPGRLMNLCPGCGSPLLIRYDLDQVKQHFKKSHLSDRLADMWRYLEVLPVDGEEDIITLGEGYTPLLHFRRLGEECDFPRIYLKDESLNPTGSFKARGLSAAVTMARKLGARKLCIPTAGNAGGALAAYAAPASIEAHIFMPADTPIANQVEVRMTGAHIYLVEGLITDAGRIMAERKEQEGWFDVSTLKEPYRIEGKKTMGYELAEQFNWKLPSVILYPTGGGTGLIGMWKAFQEMEEMGWIDARRPRMVAVQSEGCAPIVKAFREGRETAEAWPQAHTFASGIRVPKAIGDFLILQALRASHGQAVAVPEAEIYQAIFEVGAKEGVFMCPEGAACWAAFRALSRGGWIRPEETVVVFNTGAGHKYIDSLTGFDSQV